ncbi:SctD/MshK family protein [Pseudomonas sp. LRF_L74]|uniref:SctD/MshK family protein n=1 Tax=Pseudomonas sp. LRF_L74 TaxID=3369422 RepID=UPI003F5F42A5
MTASLRTGLVPLAMPRLLVVAGVHAGASLPIDQPEWHVGSSTECDVVLSDPGLAARHFRICLGKRHAVTLEATGGDLWVDEVEVARGSGYRAHLPVRVRVADMIIELQGPAQRGRLPLRLPPLAAWFKGNAAVVGAGVVVACLLAYPFIGMREADASASVQAMLTAPVAMADNTAPENAAQALRGHLDQAGLQHLQLDAQGSYLQVSGEVGVREMEQWRATQRWFDETYGRTHLLHGAVSLRSAPAAPRVRFQAVWNGDKPYVIGERGQRLYPGAALSDGWLLERIEAERIILARDGQEFSLTL